MVYSRTQDMRETLAEKMSALLSAEPTPDQQSQMSAVVNLLEDNGFPAGDPNMTSPAAFSRDLFLTGALGQLVENAIETKFDPEGAETPEDLVLRLLPSDGHLD
jgi:hypothetical protein